MLRQLATQRMYYTTAQQITDRCRGHKRGLINKNITMVPGLWQLPAVRVIPMCFFFFFSTTDSTDQKELHSYEYYYSTNVICLNCKYQNTVVHSNWLKPTSNWAIQSPNTDQTEVTQGTNRNKKNCLEILYAYPDGLTDSMFPKWICATLRVTFLVTKVSPV